MTNSAEEPRLPACSMPGTDEAGTDEVGRGCLAGPVYAAAVILPDDFCHPGITDSKQLSHKERMALRQVIFDNAVAWAVGIATEREIDTLNILRASILAMHRALRRLSPQPRHIAVDGNKFMPYDDIPWHSFVKGDARYANIAAASIIAKTERDIYMQQLAAEYPQYGWDINKGYPTAAHRAAIAAYGPTPYHRRSFRLLPPDQAHLF